ncbi:unnamed protein product [Kuraishia capsulata CBS 1993]|uniref:Amidohydrolase-related domain-containing protein n=1 Tax=Kuraishia capsulata CBS 1993 TaxID=1382522 RepID=W6MS33_9ASCO|nr:uncharacterized protein KUCA_T00005487001 [Kuraishia capsulata CBS 1993]CDK29499.1 unnamed protein product [Kuraishia capsulata CBS 1993]
MTSPALKEVPFTVYYGTLVHTPTLGELEVIVNARVGVDETGTIVYVHKHALHGSVEEESPKNAKIVRLNGFTEFFLPGFIDTHIHAPQYPNCGVFGNSTLFSWLTKYTYPVEMALVDPMKAQQVYEKVVKRTLAHGTTCCAYYATIHVEPTNILADSAYGNGQRAFIGRSCMDCGKPIYNDEDGEGSTLAVINHIREKDPEYALIKPILAPRNANKCSEGFMKWLAAKSKELGLPIETHLSETEEEVEQIMQMFPHCKTYAEIYDYHNLLTEKTILGHCVFLSEEELALINERKCGISHCPTSNSCLTSGEARLRWMLDNNTKVGLGTDVSGGFSPSMLTTARHAVLVSRHVAMKTKKDHDKLSVNEALYLATLGGANVIGMGDSLGTFAVGKKWECQQINIESLDLFDFLNPSLEGLQAQNLDDLSKFQDLIDKWVFNGDDRNVRRVYVNGRCVVDKSSLT